MTTSAVSLVLLDIQTIAQDDFTDENGNEEVVDNLFEDDMEIVDPEDIERLDSVPGGNGARALEGDREEVRAEENEELEELSPVQRPSRFTRSTRRPQNFSRNSRSFGNNSNSLNEPTSVLNFAENIPNPNEKLRMDFIQTDIEEVVKYFSERLRKKFIYDPSILSGKITIISPTEVTVAEAYQAFLSAMEIRGYVVYPTGAYLKIEKVNNARKSPVPLYQNSLPLDDSYVTRIITLKFLSVGDIRRAVQDLVSRTGGDVIEHAPTNTLIVSDYASNIRRIIRILNILDVEGFQEQIEVIPLEFANAQEVAQKINEIFPTGGSSASARRTTRRSRRTATSSAARNNGEGVIQKVVSDDRTNSLIILGSERGIEQVKRFIAEIDVPIEGGDGQIHVYPLQNVNAEDLSQTLASLTANASGNQSSTTTRRTTRTQRTTSQQDNAQNSANLFDGDVRITADPRTNALIVQSSRRDFEILKGIIRQLDVRRRQVFIESVILETTVGGNSSFGTNVRGPLARTSALGREAGQTDGADKSTAAFGFGGLSAGGLAGTLSGLLGSTAITGLALGFQSGGTIDIPVPNPSGGDATTQSVPLLTAVVQLAANNNRINVLSTPHILATANEEAVISIGEEIPQISSVQNTDAGNQISNFNRIRVATELSITPQINAGDYLTLKIQQQINERGAEVIPDSGQIATTTREATTTAIVKDGQTIVIGGIMRDVKTESITKVPFLGDIPILGWLFKSRSSNTNKVNLLLFITPHIIRDTADADDQFFKRLKQREGFLKSVGIDEARGVPISGYSPEQLNFLDEDYIKSLKLEYLPTELPAAETTPEPTNEGFEQPDRSTKTLGTAEPEPSPAFDDQQALPSPSFDLPPSTEGVKEIEEPSEESIPNETGSDIESFIVPDLPRLEMPNP